MTEGIADTILGQTPLSSEDLEGLKPKHITLRQELNEFEERNIYKATSKFLVWKGAALDVTDYLDLMRLHKIMFSDTWQWAGKYREREVQVIGIDPGQIPMAVKNACEDFKYWRDHEIYSAIEAAIRFHHRLIVIHPFANGNGRHARFIADIYLYQIKQKSLAWGGGNLSALGPARSAYLSAMRKADKEDFSDLILFATGVG